MDRERMMRLLDAVASGEVTPASALDELAVEPVTSLGFARVDHNRAVREGFPEVVLAMGKTPRQTARIALEVAGRSGRVLVTRVEPEHLAALREAIPAIQHNPDARLAWYESQPRQRVGEVAVVSAGTADIPVAEEAAITAELAGARVSRIYDAGVAGLHRILAEVPALRRANVVVVVAGMDGALPSVVAGLVANPVIAVPTSVGYGAAFGGLAALLTMLNACATGVSVVNIDNGFGAGFLAASINRLATADGTRE